MKKSDTAILTVNFPGAEKYHKDYFNSLSEQSDSDFDLILINDNARMPEYPLPNYSDLSISSKKSFAEIRNIGLKYCLDNGYTNLIFSDIDDELGNDRIEKSKLNLANHPVIFNDLTLINEDSEIIKRSYISGFCSEDFLAFDDILDRNVMGLTNSGINLLQVRIPNIPDDIVAIDWFLFSSILLQGIEAKFVRETVTYYRQDENNTVGMTNSINEKKIKFFLFVKKLHYTELIKRCSDNNPVKTKIRAKLDEIMMFEEIFSNQEKLKRYVEFVNSHYSELYQGWWSEIISLSVWRQHEE